jgi:Mg2+ and Co2+ transporter CorA
LSRAAVAQVLQRADWCGCAAATAKSGEKMESTIRFLTMLALIAVVAALLAGLWNMMRGTSPNLSQTLMRWRVGLQFLAIVVAMILVYFLRP